MDRRTSLYSGQSLRVLVLDDGLVELRFDRDNDAINKFDTRTVDELREASNVLARDPTVRGVLITSAKDVFIVGADIGEFRALFALSEADIAKSATRSNTAFLAFEDLPVPTVVAINGFALGGGLELALAADYRVLASSAQIGLPEVKLGLFPGFGGTVRLPRVAGLATALEWIGNGKQYKADAALAAGVVDAVSEPAQLRDAALAWLRQAAAGERDWRARRAARLAPIENIDATVIDAARRRAEEAAVKHQPAALAAIDLMQKSAAFDRARAQAAETAAFARIARTQAASSLVQIFLNDQALKRLTRERTRALPRVKLAAVLGAGIMGGGIASTSALAGVPVRMKDIQQTQLDLGIGEATKVIAKQVANGRLARDVGNATLASIVPQLDYTGFRDADIVVEAVVEDVSVKRNVLADVERELNNEAVVASNTSSLRIDDLAGALQRPQNFVGMHFFNPVPVMPLVEIIEGTNTGAHALATAVGYAAAMGKTPVVVKDCPGFLVNRIVTPYTSAFFHLLADGADFVSVDRAVEAFGWPMGPAYLQDVVGLDTASHVGDTIAAGYGERMRVPWANASKVMADHKRYGQKNGIGFYRYTAGEGGRPNKTVAVDSYDLIATIQPNGRRAFSSEEINERMMLALILEAARCLADGVIGTAGELDMALVLGIGFPQHLGGALKYADWLGLDRIVALADRYAAYAPIYRAPDALRTMVREGRRYYDFKHA